MALCAADGVDCVDLRTAFVGAADSAGYWADRLDNHPGPRANRIAARMVAERFGSSWRADAVERARRAEAHPQTKPAEGRAATLVGQARTLGGGAVE